MTEISFFKGSPNEVGLAIGRRFGPTYLDIQRRLGECIQKANAIDQSRLGPAVERWFRSLPDYFQEEFLGLAKALECPVEKLIAPMVMEQCTIAGCTGFIARVDETLWIGRNNDYYMPGFWNHVTVREMPGRLATMVFGLPGDVFSGTGMNERQIWLHYNWLPVWDEPARDSSVWTPFVWLREALETCSSLAEVERSLADTRRDGGMALFAADGKTGEAAYFECSCSEYRRLPDARDIIVAANHYNSLPTPDGFRNGSEDSRARQSLMRAVLTDSPHDMDFDVMIDALIGAEVKDARSDWRTVYSTLVNPVAKQIWVAADGFSSLSKRSLDPLSYPWK